jgi:hypothetical protein
VCRHALVPCSQKLIPGTLTKETLPFLLGRYHLHFKLYDLGSLRPALPAPMPIGSMGPPPPPPIRSGILFCEIISDVVEVSSHKRYVSAAGLSLFIQRDETQISHRMRTADRSQYLQANFPIILPVNEATFTTQTHSNENWTEILSAQSMAINIPA